MTELKRQETLMGDLPPETSSPSDSVDGSEIPKPRVVASIMEFAIVVGVVSFLWSILLPAVNHARARQDEPPVLPWLVPLYDTYPVIAHLVFPACMMVLAATSLRVMHWLLPDRYSRLFQRAFAKQPRPQQIEPKPDSRPAVATAILSFFSTALGWFAASHFRADRTNRRPVITWEGPIAEYAQSMAVLGWCLSVGAIAAGAFAISRYRSRLNWLAKAGVVLAGIHCFGSCFFYAVMTED